MFNEEKNAWFGTQTPDSLISSQGTVDFRHTETKCRFEYNCDFFSLNVLLLIEHNLRKQLSYLLSRCIKYVMVAALEL